MKKILIFSFLFIVSSSIGQTKKTSRVEKSDSNRIMYITNKKNFEQSIFKDLDNEVKKYSFDAILHDYGKYDFISELEKNYSKAKALHDGTAISFVLDKDASIKYSYPIDMKRFNDNYFKRKLYPINSESNNRVKISVRIYQTEENPIIVIDCVKKIE